MALTVQHRSQLPDVLAEILKNKPLTILLNAHCVTVLKQRTFGFDQQNSTSDLAFQVIHIVPIPQSENL
jgi:branched-subunit amino acid transport protein